MKTATATLMVLATIFATTSGAEPDRKFTISDLSVRGRIEGENIVFTLDFTADVKERRTRIPLVVGDVALYQSGHVLGSFRDRFHLAPEYPQHGAREVDPGIVASGLHKRQGHAAGADAQLQEA